MSLLGKGILVFSIFFILDLVRWKVFILSSDTFIDYCLSLQLRFILCKTASGAGFVSSGTITGLSDFVDSSFF